MLWTAFWGLISFPTFTDVHIKAFYLTFQILTRRVWTSITTLMAVRMLRIKTKAYTYVILSIAERIRRNCFLAYLLWSSLKIDVMWMETLIVNVTVDQRWLSCILYMQIHSEHGFMEFFTLTALLFFISLQSGLECRWFNRPKIFFTNADTHAKNKKMRKLQISVTILTDGCAYGCKNYLWHDGNC